jgi:hypothetical protein
MVKEANCGSHATNIGCHIGSCSQVFSSAYLGYLGIIPQTCYAFPWLTFKH